MKLFYAAASPFVRKVMVSAIELGLEGRIEKVAASAHPVNRNAAILEKNGLGQVPTLVLDDGRAIFDSRVICEYLDELAGGGKLFPKGEARWQALTDQSLADGIAGAALLVRYETTIRPKDGQSQDWIEGQLGKVTTGLAAFEKQAKSLAGRIDIGTIALGCALGYLDLRFAELEWRNDYPALAAWKGGLLKRPSFANTSPSG